MPRLPHTSNQAAEVFITLLEHPEQWWHGYGLMQATRLKSGTLYPLLIRLSDEGLLNSRWEIDADNGRPRREYQLTSEGRLLAYERVARFQARQAKHSDSAATA